MAKKTDAGKPATKKKPQVETTPKNGDPKPDLAEVRTQIDGIDRRIQELIAERAPVATSLR